ncbi:MAG: betaine/proline/choline family ABC transporter ATP-binding protein [Formosimonas sp.]
MSNKTATSTTDTAAVDNAIEIKSLFKVFGSDPQGALKMVQDGISKHDLKVEHNHVVGLHDINLDIPRGKVQVVMGLSGSGKSTLIRHLNRLIEPTAGQVLVNGVDVLSFDDKALQKFRQTQVAMVFQKFGLLPHITVLENIEFGLKIRGVAAKERAKKSEYWMERVGLAGYGASYPNELSGGMQQRVGLARALASEAPILLMDEAFSALDPIIKTEMQTMLLDIQQEVEKTIVFISHDLDEALRLGDSVAILQDGVMVQNATPYQIILAPENDYVAQFTRDVNRAKVLRCKHVMNKVVSQEELPSIEAEATLEEALQKFNESDAVEAHVVSKKGKVIGTVTVSDILSLVFANDQKEAV